MCWDDEMIISIESRSVVKNFSSAIKVHVIKCIEFIKHVELFLNAS